MRTKKGLLIALYILSLGIAKNSIAVGAEPAGVNAAVPPPPMGPNAGEKSTPTVENPSQKAAESPADNHPAVGDTHIEENKKEEEENKKEGEGEKMGQETPKKKKKHKKHRRGRKGKHDRGGCVSRCPTGVPGLEEQNRLRQMHGACRAPNGSDCTMGGSAPATDAPATGCSTGGCSM